MSEVFTDGGRADKNLKLVVRIVGGVIMFIAILLTFFINPHVNSDKFSNETMWEAVHPFNWFFDTLGVAAMLFYALYVCGLAGKTIYFFAEPKKEKSVGLIHALFAVSVVLIILMYVV
jgi:hypothetical protein